jgi:hypothetical protein
MFVFSELIFFIKGTNLQTDMALKNGCITGAVTFLIV